MNTLQFRSLVLLPVSLVFASGVAFADEPALDTPSDAGFDHAADVLDGERPAREPFGSGGGGNVHLLMSMAGQL